MKACGNYVFWRKVFVKNLQGLLRIFHIPLLFYYTLSITIPRIFFPRQPPKLFSPEQRISSTQGNYTLKYPTARNITPRRHPFARSSTASIIGDHAQRATGARRKSASSARLFLIHSFHQCPSHVYVSALSG